MNLYIVLSDDETFDAYEDCIVVALTDKQLKEAEAGGAKRVIAEAIDNEQSWDFDGLRSRH